MTHCAECDKDIFHRSDYLCRICRIKAFEGLCEQCLDAPVDKEDAGFAGFCRDCKRVTKCPVPIFAPEPEKAVDEIVRALRAIRFPHDDPWDNP